MANTGCVFDRSDELLERLQHAPGEEAREELAPTADGPAPSRWTLRGIRATFPWLKDYTLSGVWRTLQRWKIRLRSPQVRQHSPDPDYSAKVDHLLACLQQARAHPDEVVIVFLDEMGYYRWPTAGRSWGAAAPAREPVAGRDGPNNKQWRVIGALNALTGRVDYLDAYIIGRDKVGVFYRQLVKAYPDAQRIYVVQDNWSIHTHPDVQAVLAELPTITSLVADVCAVAQPDREAVALATRAGSDDAPTSRQLATAARAGQRFFGAVCRTRAGVTPLCWSAR